MRPPHVRTARVDRRGRGRRAGFSLLEVQVAFVVLGIALAGLCPLVVMQLRMTKRIEAQFDPRSTYCLVPSSGSYAFDASGKVIGFASGNSATDRWARKLGAMASLRSSASLAGSVYHDLNVDGFKQPFEPGIAGVTVTLSSDDAQGGAVSLVAQTASNGAYLFTNLAPGTYTITEAQPPTQGYIDGQATVGTQGGAAAGNNMISSIVLGPGVNGTGYNFGEIRASLSGFVYVDVNGNGARDDGEPGIGGVTLALSGTAGAFATTSSTGYYLFSNLQPGTYTIAETQPTGYTDGLDSQGSLGGQVPQDDTITGIPVGGGDQGVNYNFGEHVNDATLGSLSGFVYADRNNDGFKQPSEPGIEDAMLTLSGTDDQGGSVNRITTTDAVGGYSFTNLAPGSYSITKAPTPGYLDGQDTIRNLLVDAGVNGNNNNFGEMATGPSNTPTTASLAGYVFVDQNGNGVRDEAEPGIAGVTLALSGTASAFATTASTGYYLFSNLQPGTYTITETHPTGYTDGPDSAGSQGGTVQDEQVSNIPLAAGVGATGYNFGEHVNNATLGSLSGFVYADWNNDGIKQPSEPGIAGINLTLSGTDDRGPIPSITTTSTADGSYLFPNLAPGTYTISESQTPGYLDGQDIVGTQRSGTAGNDVLSDIVLPSGVNGNGNNFGELQKHVAIRGVSKDVGDKTLTVHVEVSP